MTKAKLPPEHPLVRRVAVADRVAQKFLRQEFKWGERDCVRMAHLVVTGLGLPSPVRRAGTYRSERTAMRALAKAGFKTIDEALDQMFPRIAPAEALPADILGFKSACPQMGSALGVALSNGRCVAFIDDPSVGGNRAILGHSHCAEVAWRVI